MPQEDLPSSVRAQHELAPAKINLTLRVIGRRLDGYHALASVVAFAEAGDRLALRPRQAGASSLTVTGPFAHAITGENLVIKALSQVERAAGRTIAFDVVLEKNLPVAAGIGGGSADAAALLRAVRRAMPELAETIDWLAIAARLGADVPVCLASRPALMTGIGELLEPIELPRLDIVLANAGETVPADKTRRVFTALAAPPIATVPKPSVPSLHNLDAVVGLAEHWGNDLERAAASIAPAIAPVKAAVAASAGCRIAFLSGAGPTVVGLFSSATEATAAARALSQAHPSWWVTATALVGSHDKGSIGSG